VQAPMQQELRAFCAPARSLLFPYEMQFANQREISVRVLVTASLLAGLVSCGSSDAPSAPGNDSLDGSQPDASAADTAPGDAVEDAGAQDATAGDAEARDAAMAADSGTSDAMAHDSSAATDGASDVDAVATDAGYVCPASAPVPGSPCVGTESCSYGGGICCGGGYSCSSNTWQLIFANCECIAPDSGGPPEDAGVDAKDASDGASYSCGTQTCAASQYCVSPTCGGGAAPTCQSVDDAGTCDAGWTLSTDCYVMGSGFGVGCMPPPCTPPAPYCVDLPDASCDQSKSQSPFAECNCVPSDVCDGAGSCIGVTGHNVTCGSA